MYMIHNRRVCEKIQGELDAVIGRKRSPKLEDRNHLPYVEAVLSEIQRISNVAPLGIAHRTTETVQFQEYTIPKDTVMIVSLYSLNMDKNYWLDPEVFRPERFLNDNGEYIPHAEQFIPFGSGNGILRNSIYERQLINYFCFNCQSAIGKRRCMGENLAKASLFLYFATFMHAFDMIIPHGVSMPNTQPNDGITLQPKPFQLQLKSRF